MRIPFAGYSAVPVVFAAAKLFQPLAVVAVILTLTLVVALRRTERLKTWRQLWIVIVMVGSGLIVATAFLAAVQWMVRIGVF
jgi:hypothetical protein